MNRAWLSTLPLLLVLGAASAPSGADPNEDEQRRLIKQETQILISDLPRAVDGDMEAMERLVGLASGHYIHTAEGEKWIAETYLDLLVKQPYGLLSTLARQNQAILINSSDDQDDFHQPGYAQLLRIQLDQTIGAMTAGRARPESFAPGALMQSHGMGF